MNTTNRWAGAVLLMLTAQWCAGAGAAWADAKAGTGADAPATELKETDMSHTGKTPEGGTVTVPWKLLGGAVGNQTVNGVRVELFVLEAQDPDKLKPGDPNHAFTVTLKDDKSGEFLKQGDVSIDVSAGAGPARHTSMGLRSDGIFRGGVSLPQPGEYRLTIAFNAEGRKGKADFPYEYRRSTGPTPAHQHQH
jgi:hypothetical protein